MITVVTLTPLSSFEPTIVRTQTIVLCSSINIHLIIFEAFNAILTDDSTFKKHKSLTSAWYVDAIEVLKSDSIGGTDGANGGTERQREGRRRGSSHRL